MFIGRKQDIAQLKELLKRKQSGIAVLYGRRRVGKTALIREVTKNYTTYFFEGIEGEHTKNQLTAFRDQLNRQFPALNLTDTDFHSWDAAFSLFTETVLKEKKAIVVFDELQWMAANRTKLISIIKYYWDNFWKQKGVSLILCGSIASFMINKVVKSKALYGRISLELPVRKLLPSEAAQMIGTRSNEEKILYLLVFGGVPKYLEEIQKNRSFEHNLNRLCFMQNGLMVKEFERIFYSQFTEAKSYLAIVESIANGAKTLQQVADATSIKSGGGLHHFLLNLINADFIRKNIPFGKSASSKKVYYSINDEFLSFYFKYIRPYEERILVNKAHNLFGKMIKPQWKPWLGLAFERYCLNYAMELSEKMGFAEEVESISTLPTNSKGEAQIDLLYKRFDKVIVLTEIKFQDTEIGSAIIPEIERKKHSLKIPRGFTVEKALISTFGPSKALCETEYFDYSLSLDDILE